MIPKNIVVTWAVLLLLLVGMASDSLYAQEPFLKWAIALHDPTYNYAYSVATDQDGSVYTMGHFADTMDTDPGPDEHLLISSGTYFAEPITDIFVQKLDSSGNFDWAVQLGGSDFDGIWKPVPPPFPGPTLFGGGSVSTDFDGNVLICGIFFSDTVDLDPGPDVVPAYRSEIPGLSPRPDYMIVKLDGDGHFLWGHTFGGAGEDRVDECVVDNDGNVILVGEFTDTVDFDPSANSTFLSADPVEVLNPQPNLFIQKLDADGNFLWAKQVDGPYWESPTDVDVDSEGNIYVTGGFVDTVDFDPGQGVFQMEAPAYQTGEQNTFLLKVDAQGDFDWAFQVPGTGTITETMEATGFTPSLAVDYSDNVVLTSKFSDTVDVDPSLNEHLVWPDGQGRFLLKLSASGGFEWVGQTDVTYSALDTDEGNAIYATGSAGSGADADPGPGVTEIDANGILVTRIDSMGNLIWAHSLENSGTPYQSYGIGIAVNESGDVNVVGVLTDPFDFDPSVEDTLILDSSPPNLSDAFNLKWGQHDIEVGVNNHDYGIWNVFPNPTSELVYIETVASTGLTVQELCVFNGMGQLIFRSQMDFKAESRGSSEVKPLVVNVSSWASGLYNIVIIGNGSVVEKKILKL